jgi:hypothetical protein
LRRARGRLAILAWLPLALLPALAGCEGGGGVALFGNPTLSRLAATSDDEAKDLPPTLRYRWAWDRYEIEASDFRRGIRLENPQKVSGAASRAAHYLAAMRSMLGTEESRQDAMEAVDRHLALAEATSGGRNFRSAGEAARDLEGWVEERLHPDVVRLAPAKAPAEVPEDKKD